MPLTPKNRKEQWLEGLIQHETTLTPKNRPEAWMKEIIDASGGGGTGGGVLVVGANMTETTMTLDKTWKEIKDAPFAVITRETNIGGIYSKIAAPIFTIDNDSLYHVYYSIPSIMEDNTMEFNVMTLETDSENGYPTITIH